MPYVLKYNNILAIDIYPAYAAGNIFLAAGYMHKATKINVR